MIERAKKRKHSGRVNFIQGSEDDLPTHHYDGVITNFFLDMFVERNLSSVIMKIKNSLSNKALWVVTDFINERKAHAIKLWCMYRFFRIVTRIEATYLSDWHRKMIDAGFQISESRKFNNGFIVSNMYQLTSQPDPQLK